MQSKGSTGPAIIATDQIELAAKQIHLFGESSRLSLTKEAELTSDKKTVVHGAGAGLGLAGGATLAGGKVIVAGKGATLVLDTDAKLDGAPNVMLNCGGEGGGVSVADRDPKLLDTPRDLKTKKVKIRALDSDRLPMPAKKYRLVVDAQVFEERTGPDGQIEHDVAEEATEGQLTVWPDAYPDGPRLRWAVKIEPKLPEPNTVPGGRIRLSNLAYYEGPPIVVMDDRLEEAIKQFQIDQSLRVTGKLDPATTLRLVEVHGD